MPRRGAILAAPCRKALSAKTYDEARHANGGHLDVVTWLLMPRIREVADEIQPYWQRTIFEVCPELSLYQMNGDVPMAFRKRAKVGQFERQAVLRERMPGCDRVLEVHVPGARQTHLTDACAALWTARRIVSRGINRVPEDPEWSSDGLRMEIVR
jgi:predicted RNase H-like nuclease